ncbi:hypothetical protein GCM10010347_48010 [Streptomyces cirratus]|uniref:Uncharacterized protein n=1 Tax=Streptomyces cirratus TaxID=68187 RepID=A0ABQ3EXP1_9ACTN|nr:hypothetical protein GCM10010347_48010 [Streptomyces cirratus]
MNTIRPTSSQLTPHPHASGIAPSSATKGTVMNKSNAICSTDRLLSPPRVADGPLVGDGAEAPSIRSSVMVTVDPLGGEETGERMITDPTVP